MIKFSDLKSNHFDIKKLKIFQTFRNVRHDTSQPDKSLDQIPNRFNIQTLYNIDKMFKKEFLPSSWQTGSRHT